MTALNDERRPGGGGESSSSLAKPYQNTPTWQNDVWHTMATVCRVMASRGRYRSVAVARGPWYGWPHVLSGNPDFITCKHAGGCDAGRCVVHLATAAGQVAA